MGGQVALVGAHLVEASCDELIQAHERVGVEATWVCVVLGSGVEGCPFVQHEGTGADLQGFVGACHKEGRGDDIKFMVGSTMNVRGGSTILLYSKSS